MGKTSFNAVISAILVSAVLVAGPFLWVDTPDAKAHPPPSRSAPPSPTQARAEPWGPVQLVVYKARRLLALYRRGDLEREYPVVLGLVPEGTKRHAFDARTPEGLYHVVGKRPHHRWQVFLALDYPNAGDRRRYQDEVRGGTIPDDPDNDGRPFAIGDGIGLHGNDRADEQARGVDWTKGCIALEAEDIAEVAEAVEVGTPVWIVK